MATEPTTGPGSPATTLYKAVAAAILTGGAGADVSYGGAARGYSCSDKTIQRRALKNDGISLSQLDLSSGSVRVVEDGSSIFPNLQIISNGS